MSPAQKGPPGVRPLPERSGAGGLSLRHCIALRAAAGQGPGAYKKPPQTDGTPFAAEASCPCPGAAQSVIAYKRCARSTAHSQKRCAATEQYCERFCVFPTVLPRSAGDTGAAWAVRTPHSLAGDRICGTGTQNRRTGTIRAAGTKPSGSGFSGDTGNHAMHGKDSARGRKGPRGLSQPRPLRRGRTHRRAKS